MDKEIIKELEFIRNSGEPLIANFIVAGIFEDALGKFPVGSIGGFSYFDINSALQHFISTAVAKRGQNNSKLV